MELASKKTIKKLLAEIGGPVKGLGQNFLVSEKIVDDLISIAEINSKDKIVEIGPGLGVLTEKLTEKAGFVTAVEKDRRMIKHLKELDKNNLKLINADFLKLDPSKYTEDKYKVVSNLPFNAATPIIRKLLKEKSPTSITVIMQEEVAERIESKGEKENFLSIITKFRGSPKVFRKVPKKCFYPSPKVSGAILKIKPHSEYSDRGESFFRRFFNVVEAGFQHPRKQLKNNLKDLFGSKKETIATLEKIKIKPRRRPEDLSVEDWIKITELI